MGLFDIFTFKKQAAEVFSKENIADVLDKARTSIIEQVKAKYPGPEKMAAVVIKVQDLIIKKSSSCTNKLVLWLVGQLLNIVPTITQLVYNFLKEKVENL